MEIIDKVAIVTGGASGLGKACVRQLVQKGARVAILDMNKDQGTALAKEFEEKTIFLQTDVSDETNVKESIEAVADRLDSIHFVINCAGMGIPMKVLGKDGPMSMEPFIKTMQVNLNGTMNVICHAVAKIVENDSNADGEKGVVINTSSIAAFEGQIGQVAYTASKAAIAGITLPLAREFADYGIRVITIAPGIFDTPILGRLSEKVKASLARQIPFPKRLGDPKEFAFLASHIIENPVMNGETIRLDGSLRMTDR
ncbi:MAG: SDR family NAD(P)-dependent oxidoreductase [Deltaproteobacteria bacterium]|nr:SDR family NAD(P)-dependent oxidoreductase [Deltaproteobacteria bacterium]